MGMSASQARLLSLTARLTNNELNSQMLTNSKLRLADETKAASSEYMDALSSEKLMFMHYNDNGESSSFDLTPSLLYTYEPLKNQYSIQNSSGQNLVNATDAKNYEETDSLYNFLDRYGLVEGYTRKEVETIDNPAYAVWQKEHEEWINDEPQQGDYTKITETEVTTRVNTSPIYPALTGILNGCFSGSVDGYNCFMHVLSALIGVGEHTTSSGDKYTVSYKEDGCSEHGNGWCWNTYSTKEEIGQELRNSLYNDTLSTEEYNSSLKTNYGTVNCAGTGKDAAQYGNNVYQKLVDFLWEVHAQYHVGDIIGGLADPDMLARFFYIIEFDLGESYTDTVTETQEEFDEAAYNDAYKKWQESEKKAPPE